MPPDRRYDDAKRFVHAFNWLMTCILLFGFASLGCVVYVLAHFIHKFW